MADYSVARIDEMEAIYKGAFKRARAELGVSAWGMQVIDIPPGSEHYPEHDHAQDGQEEVYVALRGAGDIEIDGERVELSPEVMVRVGPGTRRKVWPGAEGIRLLVIGGYPGKPYSAPEITELGGPDPMGGNI